MRSSPSTTSPVFLGNQVLCSLAALQGFAFDDFVILVVRLVGIFSFIIVREMKWVLDFNGLASLLVVDDEDDCEGGGLGASVGEFKVVEGLGREGEGGGEVWGVFEAGDGVLVNEESVHGVLMVVVVKGVTELSLVVV
ncbi:hypothetical protein C1H46_004857 [Malus baccata]|uniref:Uncharacterized protein n=1 Tax=Malus baccata TaxID=106549 RepID=A0A540NEN9_MALBA|nr:hypothetical protein C1H46_004857 [Malus baccata]